MDSPPHQVPPVEATNNETAAPAPQTLDSHDTADPIPIILSDPPPNTRRCFVCLVDEPEATLPSDWCLPCTCTLEGHQQCVMEWVTNWQAQAKPIKCPICKSPITVTEKSDSTMRVIDYLDRRCTEWSFMFLVGFAVSSTIVSSSVYGAKAIDWFAGPDALVSFLLNDDDATGMVAARQGGRLQARQRDLPVKITNLAVLPLIAPGLVLNRLWLGDIISIPVSILYTTLIDQPNQNANWPPSAQRTISLYPVLQATYFHLHRTLSRRLEARWKAQAQKLLIQPAAQQPVEQIVEQPVEPPAAAENQNQNQNQDQRDPRAGRMFGVFDIQLGEDDDNEVDRRIRGVDVAGKLFQFLAGTLVWPGVCYGAGELLRLALPSRFVTRPFGGPVTGILQQRWGRSLVGGCIFIMFRDAFNLWVKYRKTMKRATRHIKNARSRNSRS